MNADARATFSASLVFSFLAVCAVAGRIWARKTKGTRLSADDWIILVDLVLALGLSIMTEWAAFHAGIGIKLTDLSPEVAMTFLKQIWANELLAAPIIGTVKISVLLFYKRIFIQPRFHIIANILIFLSISWAIAFTCTLAFNLIPFNLEWGLEVYRPHNLNFGAMLISMGTSDILLDLIILSLPIPMIGNLNLSRRRKVVVAAFLGLGAFCVVASSVRLVYLTQFLKVEGADDTFNTVVNNILLWSVIEPCASIVAACLPTLGPLVAQGSWSYMVYTKAVSFFSTLYLGRSSRKSETIRTDSDDSERVQPMESIEGRKWRHAWRMMNNKDTTITTVGLGSMGTQHEHEKGIVVKNSFGSQVESAEGDPHEARDRTMSTMNDTP